jgi:hypothetical protein
MKVVSAGHRFAATHIGSVLDGAVAALCCYTDPRSSPVGDRLTPGISRGEIRSENLGLTATWCTPSYTVTRQRSWRLSVGWSLRPDLLPCLVGMRGGRGVDLTRVRSLPLTLMRPSPGCHLPEARADPEHIDV